MHLLTIFLTIPSEASPQTDEAQNRRKNPKLERRNLKQIRMTEILMLRTKKLLHRTTQALGCFEF